MSLERAKRMELVSKLAQQQEQQCADELLALRQQQQQELAQKNDLERYLDEYMRDLNQRGGGLSAQVLAQGRGFLSRLDSVCQNQNAKLNQIDQKVALALKAWQLAHQKTQAILELVEKLRAEHNEHLERQLQKQLDELSQRRFLDS